ncbi:MAG: alpha/beta hydrolase [Bacteroidetes bacterium]|nr:alpha/beta hydrolase [Bacteroidota bacterium]MBS1930097.1 alpha/beta hydrolase [Bacteroidota bacterium]
MIITSLLYGKKRKDGLHSFLNNRAPIRCIPQRLHTAVSSHIAGDHIYLELGAGKPIIFCHGLFGGIFNIDKLASMLASQYRFIMPFLPMYDLPLKNCRVKELGNYIERFIQQLQLKEAVFIGNSMGGGALTYYASMPGNISKGVILCGSSGLTNIPISNGYFKRKDFEFVKSATKDIFFNRSVPTDEMVKDIFQAIQQTELVIRSIRFTKSATQQKTHDELSLIQTPTLLIWGKQDPITPAEAAPEFQRLIKNSELVILEECGHVATQEKPEEFYFHLNSFLKKTNY